MAEYAAFIGSTGKARSMIVASTTSTQDTVLFGHVLPNPEKHLSGKKEFGQQLFFLDAKSRVRDDRQIL